MFMKLFLNRCNKNLLETLYYFFKLYTEKKNVIKTIYRKNLKIGNFQLSVNTSKMVKDFENCILRL